MVKVTFTLDEATIQRLTEAAARRKIPKSQAVREAIEDFSVKEDIMDEAERQRKLRVVRALMAAPPTRSRKEMNAELTELRRARRHGGRLHRPE